MGKSYYDKNKDARKAYQMEYYTLNKELLRRKREIQAELEPEKTEKQRNYQRNYYLANRERLLLARKHQYNLDKPL